MLTIIILAHNVLRAVVGGTTEIEILWVERVKNIFIFNRYMLEKLYLLICTDSDFSVIFTDLSVQACTIALQSHISWNNSTID